MGLLEANCLPTNSIDFSHNEDSLQLEESILATGTRPVEELSVHVSLALKCGCLTILVLQINARGLNFAEEFQVPLTAFQNKVLGFLEPISKIGVQI
jgi:hypothetical protein